MFTQLGILFLSSFVIANASSPTCQPIRQGSADVTIYRLYWEQNGGSYQLKRDKVCETHVAANVYEASLGTCIYPILADCPIQLDGKSHNIRVSGLIQLQDEPVHDTKHFILSYHLDRNAGGVPTGEAGNADVFVFDPHTEHMGVTLQSKLDGAVPGIPLRDAVAITAEFKDGP
jgi:hypothetical protein